MTDQPLQASVALEHELVAVQHEEDLHVLLELAAPDPEVDRERVPLRVALVLDRSGSMAGSRLETVKQAAGHLLGQLTGEDQAALVVYDDNAQLITPLGPPQAAAAALPFIDVGGSTNLSGGWLKGAEQLAKADGSRRVLLLTDGHANVGVTDPEGLGGMAAGQAATGVGTTCLGIEDGYNELLLETMSRAGGGNYYFLETADEAAAAFAREFTDLAQLFAQNVSVEVRPGEPVAAVGVLNEFPHTKVPGGVQIQLPDAYAGHTASVVLCLRAPKLASLGPVQLGELVLRYTVVGDEVAAHETTIPLVANVVSAEDAARSLPDARVTDEVTILLAAKAIREAREAAEEGRVEEATETLDAAVEALDKRAAESPDADRLHEHAERVRRTSEEIKRSGFDAMSSKRLHSASFDSSTGRRPRQL